MTLLRETPVVEKRFASPRDLEQAFQETIDALPRDAFGAPRFAELGAMLIGGRSIDRALFPAVLVTIPGRDDDMTQALRPFSARSFTDATLAVDAATGELLFVLRTNLHDQAKQGSLALALDREAFLNVADPWLLFTDGAHAPLAALGFGPGMSLAQWRSRIERTVGGTTRLIRDDCGLLVRELPFPFTPGAVGTRRTFFYGTDFVCNALLASTFRLPGDEVLGYASAHIHPDDELTEFDTQLAQRVDEDVLRSNPTLAEIVGARPVGRHLISAYPSLSDIMLTIDAQYMNFKAMTPLVRTEEQYQEYAQVIVRTTPDGRVTGSRTFSYDAVARAGEIERFDKLIDTAYHSMISEDPDLGVMSEAIQEIARFTSDAFPDYFG